MAEGLRGVWQTGGDGRGSGGGHGRGPGGLTVTSACLHSVVAAQSKLYIFVNLLTFKRNRGISTRYETMISNAEFSQDAGHHTGVKYVSDSLHRHLSCPVRNCTLAASPERESGANTGHAVPALL